MMHARKQGSPQFELQIYKDWEKLYIKIKVDMSLCDKGITHRLLNAGSMMRRCLYHSPWSRAVNRPLPKNLLREA